MLKNLPQDILLQGLLSWLGDMDQMSFAMVSKLFLKYLRIIWIRSRFLPRRFLLNFPSTHIKTKDRLDSYVTSKEFREKIHSLIFDPYRQLNLEILEDKPYNLDDDVSCNELKVPAKVFLNSFINNVKKVQCLRLHSLRIESLTESDLQLLVQWINRKGSFSLKELYLSNYNVTNLPSIPNLERLKIHNSSIGIAGFQSITGYSHLHQLVLSNCNNINDVSCFDHIHDLQLRDCKNIRDVSCLNHNEKIVISRCQNIVHYSNCFRHSKRIEVRACPQEYDLIDFSESLEAKDIIISNALMIGENSDENLKLPIGPNLRRVQLEGFLTSFQIPLDSHIREIIINNCPFFTNLSSFSRIYSVKLCKLTIYTLKGLGYGNRVVEISSCHNITNFSVLKHCDKVIIKNCAGFRDTRQLQGVNDVFFSPVEMDALPPSLEGVTILQLAKFDKKVLSINFPSSLKELLFLSGVDSFLEHMNTFFERLPPRINKIQVMAEVSKFRPLMKDVTIPGFNIEFHHGINFFRNLKELK